ncbi:Rad4 transglutaminase-like domain-containing protein [Lasiosphaeria miniovina]|uniref:Rad4 transglutaminase-like domain-containing protein n=1 Tax=Lasiosphaeria miniovina TaxID=1954250 RepID=A0AA39ZRB3_9PEZI|nr:Rad4 transglutaminase-like domain-containing protein [Lasiosphaeria miniovina]KAK0702030.1 Rad4 transglutaminase-like domain-containing protein [Lasiosphaeria miniovina]
MPPHVPRKRVRDRSPPAPDITKQQQKGKAGAGAFVPPRKPTLFEDLDANSTPRSSTRNGSTAQQIDDSQDGESSLTSLSDADFGDNPPAKRQKLSQTAKEGEANDDAGDDDDDDEDEDIEFEDVLIPQDAIPNRPLPTGNLELILTRDTRISLENALGKKGPSKLERKIRIATHCVHVQLLLWHNAIRNSWLCDPEVQGILLSHIPPRLWDEVDRWRRNSGLDNHEETPKKGASPKPTTKAKRQKGKGNAEDPPSRDWGEAAKRLEKGVVDMSHGDPLFRLMKALSAWWKQRFYITAPGLRKCGYMSLERLDRLTKEFKQEGHDPSKFGERIQGLDEFRKRAQECAGSRDVGAQLFTALLRALGMEARMVASLQTLGYGWNRLEEADPEKGPNASGHTLQKDTSALHENGPSLKPKPARSAKPAATSRPSRATKRKQDESDSELLTDLEDSDDDSVIDLPPPPPKRGKAYDFDLDFPNYWTEVLSPATHKYLSVDAIVKSVIGTNRGLVESLEPRGSKADKAKQMMAYVIGFSQDGTAKDITVRYLKRQTLPGRTKGMRVPIEKVPIYNRHGKVKRYDMFDWFKTAMAGYVRGGKDHAITEVDEEEDSTDLKPNKPEKKEVKEGEETLQYYKQSKDFALERHLKREEALLPNAKPVKTFKHKAKTAASQEEPVYSRKDVVQVKSAETWHKQGRAPTPGEQPLKRVPYRAATTNRRREIAEAEAATGGKVLQGLYSFEQTEWIIPPPIQNGIIPKNGYGNIDLFVEHMCPEGAVHVPYQGTMRVCKRLGIDYAEAVVDFEFGNRMAVPVIQGVVVAEEYHDTVMEELAKDEAERIRKEDEKRRKAALAKWRKFLMGLRIVERIKKDHGHIEDGTSVFGRHGRGQAADEDQETPDTGQEDDDMGGGGGGGGFLLDGYEGDEEAAGKLTSGFFPVADDDAEDSLQVEAVYYEPDIGRLPAPSSPEPPPSPPLEPPSGTSKRKSVMSTKPKRQAAGKAKASSSRRRRRRDVPWSESDDDDSYQESGSD